MKSGNEELRKGVYTSRQGGYTAHGRGPNALSGESGVHDMLRSVGSLVVICRLAIIVE